MNIPKTTRTLLLINIIAYILTVVLSSGSQINLNDAFGLHFFGASNFKLYQLVTYMFMHGGLMHLFFNMFALWMFGVVVENVWGEKRFLLYYFVCGIGAGLIQELAQFSEFYLTLHYQYNLSFNEVVNYINQNASQFNNLTTVGASGAVYGILLAFGMLFPENRIFIFPFPIPIKAKWFVCIYAAIELYSALSNSGGNIAHMAHLGGMLFGYFLIKYWRKHPYDKVFIKKDFNFFNSKDKNKTTVNQTPPNKNRAESDRDYNARKAKEQEEIDIILDKIRKSGYDSLTAYEKQRLFEQSRK